jgi:lipopolysaccharide transport system ATP-binding protein
MVMGKAIGDATGGPCPSAPRPRIHLANVTVRLPVVTTSRQRSLKLAAVGVATGGRLIQGVGKCAEVVALDDITLAIPEGGRVGLVGHNGSGKTTLLRVLAGILRPTSGRTYVDGSVSVLLNPCLANSAESTGREFARMQSLVNGATLDEWQSHEDEIVAFAGLGRFIDMPTRVYSSGMLARLAFAVATAYTRDVILLDEFIGAGDREFQERAEERLDWWLSRASIVVLASHSEEFLDRLCTSRIELAHGRLISHVQR